MPPLKQTLCCTHPNPRIDSPEPPSRLPTASSLHTILTTNPSLHNSTSNITSLDTIFLTAASLPDDHPHAPTGLMGRNRRAEQAVSEGILGSPGFVGRVRRLGRRSTRGFGRVEREGGGDWRGSWEDGVDCDARVLGSLEIVGRVEGDGDLDVDEDPRIEVTPASPPTVAMLGKSSSAPNLLKVVQEAGDGLPRACSTYGFGGMKMLDVMRLNVGEEEEVPGAVDPAAFVVEDGKEGLDIQDNGHEKAEVDEETSVDGAQVVEEAEEDDKSEIMPLHAMDIHEQLRSMSQLSGSVDGESVAGSIHHQRTFHRRERSDITGSFRSHHTRQASNNIDSAILPSIWDRVQSPTASSTYSRPPTVMSTGRGNSPCDVFVPAPDWPLTSTPMIMAMDGAADTPFLHDDEPEENTLRPLTPSDLDQSCPMSLATENIRDEVSVRFLAPPGREDSISGVSNSTSGTKRSRTSRFLEHFSPPKKSVKKRRSIFQFLRPGSRKQQKSRSISSPVLNNTLEPTSNNLDGPSEDHSLLTVQYELTEHPRRSISLNHLGPYQPESSTHLDPPTLLQRRPSMADYECSLTIAGDDRRRPSNISVNVERLKEVQQDDRKESVQLRRRLARATPLLDEPGELMEHALMKHQEEKALFRSASKARESLGAHQDPPLLHSTSFAPSSTLSLLHRRPTELLGPLDEPDLEAGRQSLDHLPIPGNLGSRLPGFRKRAVSTAPSHVVRSQKIGTSLPSWTRYPSHSRQIRCASAGRVDDVIARDFAPSTTDTHPSSPKNDTSASIEDLPNPTNPTSLTQKKNCLSSLPRSPSTLFSNAIRYYSNIFAYGSSQNRRSSVMTGGWLEHPDLEMLAPVHASSEHVHGHAHHIGGALEERLRAFEEGVERFEGEAGRLLGKRKGGEGGSGDEGGRGDGEMSGEVGGEGVFKTQGSLFGQGHWHAHFGSEAVAPEEEEEGVDPLGRKGVDVDTKAEDRAVEAEREEEEERIEEEEAEQAEECGGSWKEGQDPAVEDLDRNALLDGTGAGDVHLSTVAQREHRASKAEVWSEMYKTCMARPISASTFVEPARAATTATLSDTSSHSSAMPQPPHLRPTKPRSPEPKPQLLLNTKASVRRFPSVTVVDDLKGHSRSVSLISVRADSAGGIVRSSTQDLIELVKIREREEREKLLGLGMRWEGVAKEY